MGKSNKTRSYRPGVSDAPGPASGVAGTPASSSHDRIAPSVDHLALSAITASSADPRRTHFVEGADSSVATSQSSRSRRPKTPTTIQQQKQKKAARESPLPASPSVPPAAPKRPRKQPATQQQQQPQRSPPVSKTPSAAPHPSNGWHQKKRKPQIYTPSATSSPASSTDSSESSESESESSASSARERRLASARPAVQSTPPRTSPPLHQVLPQARTCLLYTSRCV